MVDNINFPEDATPLSDYSGLIPLWIHSLSDLNRAEAENIFKAQLKYLVNPVDNPKKWFQVNVLKKIHQHMFGDVWEWAGVYRKSITSIGIRPSEIPVRFAELCYEVNSWSLHPIELTFVERAARIHHQLVLIHPFENGNGRFARLIADRYLLAYKCPHPIWPNHINKDGLVRKDYIQTLKSADQGDFTSLVSFMKKLGARDPNLEELFENIFYRDFIKTDNGTAMVKALLRCEANVKRKNSKSRDLLKIALDNGLMEIAKILDNISADHNNTC